jgi:hypothetical protein
MKKVFIIAAICVVAAATAQAQLIRQVINFSLVGYVAPENMSTVGAVVRATPQPFSLTDRALCYIVARDNYITLRYPQLIRVADLQGGFIGYYVTDAGVVVADASGYIGKIAQDFEVHSGVDVYNARLALHSVFDVTRSYDTWEIGYLNISGLNTRASRFTYTDGSDANTFSVLNFSAPVSGGFTNTDTGAFGCCSGSIRATSAVVRSIPGL